MIDRQTDRQIDLLHMTHLLPKGFAGSIFKCVAWHSVFEVIFPPFPFGVVITMALICKALLLDARKGMALPGTGAQLHLPAPFIPQDFMESQSCVMQLKCQGQ